MGKSVQEISNEIAREETTYGGKNPEDLTAEELKYYHAPNGVQMDRARKIWMKQQGKKVVKKVKSKVKQGIDKVKRYVAKDKAYTQQVRMADIEHEGEKRKKYKHYYPPQP